MKTKEVFREDLVVGMVLVGKTGERRRFRIEKMGAGMGGRHFPYLSLLALEDGTEAGHDTSWDSLSATYTVETV